MLNAFYDLIAHPERYLATWKNGELFIEPLATAEVDHTGEVSHGERQPMAERPVPPRRQNRETRVA